jgi:two-component system, sensor histidine kinase and response regulator
MAAAPSTSRRSFGRRPGDTCRARRGAGHSAGLGPVLRILVADDNAVNRTVVQRLLEKQGMEVLTAANGLEAAETYAKESIDLVLLDVQMPVMDGLAAARRIRSLEADGSRRTPILALTAHAMKEDRQRCLLAGMDGYLAKPVHIKELLAAIEEHTSVRAGS